MKKYSPSQLGYFEQCRLKFKFRYLDKVPVDKTETPIEFFLGSRVHEALKKLYKDQMFGRIPALEALLDYYNGVWKGNLSDKIKINSTEYGADDYRRRGEKMISDYYVHYHPFGQGRTLGLEMKVSAALPGDARIAGIVDRLVDIGGGRYEIHDYKTYATLKGAAEMEKDRQLFLYALAVFQQFPDAKRVDLVWHMLAFDREVRISKSLGELEKMGEATAQVIAVLEAAREYPPHVSALCGYCEYQRICPSWSHLFKVKALENEWMKEPAAVLVEKLSELKDEKKKSSEKMDEEMGKVEEAIIAFALDKGIDRVSGKSHIARVKSEEVVSFPPKGARQGLVEVLKSEGVWDDVSDLDMFALRRLLKEGKVDEGKIGEFETKETRRSVSLSKLKS